MCPIWRLTCNHYAGARWFVSLGRIAFPHEWSGPPVSPLGWRRGELLALRVENVDLLAGTVRIDTSKNGEPREAALTDRLKMFLQPMLVNRAPDALVYPIDRREQHPVRLEANLQGRGREGYSS